MEQINHDHQPKHRSGKVMNFASILEDNTRAQALTASTMPFIYPHLALMPDAHLGKGATVGSVIPTYRAIMPAAVGVDIGCGMIAVRTQYGLEDLPPRDQYKYLRRDIENAIPLSAGKYNTKMYARHTQDRWANLHDMATDYNFRPSDYASNWELQLGSLGSGNHFIEVSLDETDQVWLFLHSGSRGVGNKIAQHHIKVAQEECKQRYIDLPDPDLAYLIEGTDSFWAYIRQLRWAQHFAFLNRQEMMDRVVTCFEEWMMASTESLVPVERKLEVNCHHNYTNKEKVWGKDVWLSRKGAISAKDGEWGLIPGSMGTRSYVVQGKGNRLSLNSAPHGAGREYSRSAAKRQFTMEDLKAQMGDIEFNVSPEFIDEIPSAYKDIDVVMEDAKDLVTIKHTLRQIINVKGD